jgi:hypothetical protein
MGKGCVKTSPWAELFLPAALLICFAPMGVPTTSWEANIWTSILSQ